MKKIAAVCIALILLSADVSAKEFEEPEVIRCTCYCEHGKTATGAVTDYGIISGKKEWLGCVAELHRINEDGSVG